MTKVCVIGAGASGLTAAIGAAECGARVTVLEHKPEAVNKLRITGNGRCNFTNQVMNAACYHEDPDSRLADILSRFGTDDAIHFIQSLGVRVHEKFGYYYPEDDNAGSVADAIIRRCEELGVEFRYLAEDFISPQELFSEFDSLILATGGRSYKKTGSNGSGYKYLEALGIPYTWIMPALSALRSDDMFLRENAGRRIVATISVYEKKVDSEPSCLASDTGEIQINERSISGIPVMNLSRYVSEIIHNGNEASLIMDLDPVMEAVPKLIRTRYVESRKESGKQAIHGTIEISITDVEKIDKAQVVRGGVRLTNLTPELRFIGADIPEEKAVYIVGELCDVDGKCGGYNLHWAWASGNIAGKAAAKER